MKFCLMIYDMKGKIDKMKYYSCLGCGWRHAPENVPLCMRKGNKDGEMVRKNTLYVEIVEEK